jgi:predicted transcriptional regulator
MDLTKRNIGIPIKFLVCFDCWTNQTVPKISDDSGSLIGLITLTVARAIPEHKWMNTIVDDIMIPRNELIIMDANSNADQALNKMAIRKMNIVFISNGDVAGLVTKTGILNIAAERKKYFDALRQE